MEPTKDRIIAIVQARLGSSRFPEKVFAKVHGKTLLEHYLRRASAAREVERIIVATTNDPADQAIADLVQTRGFDCYRGSVNDLLDRYYRCARQYAPAAVVRLTSDDPFVDPDVIDRAVGIFREGDWDFVTNHFHPTYPEGLDTEVYRFTALERCWREARLLSEREHVFPYIQNHPELFRIHNFTREPARSELRWTVDYPCDLEMVKVVYDHLYEKNPLFRQEEILALMDQHPEIAAINAHIRRKEGVNATIANDQVVEGPVSDGQ